MRASCCMHHHPALHKTVICQCETNQFRLHHTYITCSLISHICLSYYTFKSYAFASPLSERLPRAEFNVGGKIETPEASRPRRRKHPGCEVWGGGELLKMACFGASCEAFFSDIETAEYQLYSGFRC